MKKNYFIGGVKKPISGHGGETIKNSTFINYLIKNSFEIEILDTVSGKENRLSFFLQIIKLFIFPNQSTILLSAATHTACKFLKISKWLNWHNKKIFYFVIGGTLVNYLENMKISIDDLHRASKIYIESRFLKEKLQYLGVRNVSYLPNFRNTSIKYLPTFINSSNVFRILFLSRVIPSKGIESLIRVIKRLQNENYSVLLDIYGPIEMSYLVIINKLIDNSCSIQYNGILNFDNDINAYHLISGYHCMVLPTNHYGEGFPGAFIDCFIAGIPIITTDWNSNSEIIEDGKNGFLIPANSEEDLYKYLLKVILNPELVINMRSYCRDVAKKYDIKHLLTPILGKLSK